MANNPNHIQNLKPFSYNDYRINKKGRPKKFITNLITRELKGKEEVVIEGYHAVTGKPTKIRVPMPTGRQIVQALLRQAKSLIALEGKATQPIAAGINTDRPINLVFNLQPGNDPIHEDDDK